MTNDAISETPKYQLKNPQFKDWETPPDFFKALDEEFHFTLDAAASHANALCKTYCTPEGTYEKGLGNIYDLNGLSLNWSGHRVFCNPSYDSNLYRWVEKAAKREAEIAVLLLPPSVDTKWFHKITKDFRNTPPPQALHHIPFGGKAWSGWLNPSIEVYFMEGRLHFWREGQPGNAPRAGNMLAIFRK